MRIIDKNTDFYDYLQNIYRDDSITFDRRDSFIVTKDIMCDSLRNYYHLTHYFILLQVCNTFWLFLAEIKETDSYDKPTDYKIHYLTSWKDYNKSSCLISLETIYLNWYVHDPFNKETIRLLEQDRGKCSHQIATVFSAVNNDMYRINKKINLYKILNGDGSEVEKHIPILTACGIKDYINPLDIYLAFEEFFSKQKTAAERTESVGITDKEKIENHGFDTKTSFRGK